MACHLRNQLQDPATQFLCEAELRVEEYRGLRSSAITTQIASDPHAFILRQGWASLDFREEEHAARLGKLLESLETEILSVLEATNQLRASPEFELYELTAKNAEMFDEVASKQTGVLLDGSLMFSMVSMHLGQPDSTRCLKAVRGGLT